MNLDYLKNHEWKGGDYEYVSNDEYHKSAAEIAKKEQDDMGESI